MGKIGTIGANIKPYMGRTIGTIDIPSNLSDAETALIAAEIEAINRIDSYESNICISKV